MLWLCITLADLPEESSAHEREALRALAAWAGQFSSHVSLEPDRRLLWLEIGASLRLFGGLDGLQESVEQGLIEMRREARLGVAPTLEASALLARAGSLDTLGMSGGIRGAVQPRIEALPLALLALPNEVLQSLRGSGLRRIGEVYQLSFDALARRFGPEVTDYLQRLTGLRPDVRPAFRAPLRYRRRFELPGLIENIEGLLFPLRRMLLELQGSLRARDTGVQELLLVFIHEGGKQTQLTLRTTQPQREANILLNLLRERMHNLVLPAPVRELQLRVERFAAPGDTQIDLFDSGRKREDEWRVLLDRLRARLGEKAVHLLGLRDSHEPERAWCELADASAPLTSAARPLWLLPAPQPLRQLPRICGKPERIETGGWECAEIRRDYYVATSESGSRLWLFRNADDRQWYLHGLWS